jgi:hypothetical protein
MNGMETLILNVLSILSANVAPEPMLSQGAPPT